MKLLPLFFLLISCTSRSQDGIPFNGRTIGKLPFLEYGTGEDRLGGAKMTFLDTNIFVKVIDSFKTHYKVQLSKYHQAYLDKSAFVRTNEILRPEYLTADWKVFGDSAFDYVTIKLDEKLPYRSIQQIEPSRIVVDIFGATSNSNWITQLSSCQEIKNAWLEQPEDDVMRVYIDLKHPQHWGHTIYYNGNILNIRVRHQPLQPILQKLTIAVDAGHGGDNKGADGGISHVLEKAYTLLIAKELKHQLQDKHAHVIMTREKDTALSMIERIQILKDSMPDLLISIHLNSSSRDSVNGVSTYYRYIGFRPLSTAILKRMRDLGLNEYGNVGNFNFGLNGPTDYPNCLVEVGFLSNRSDEKRILNSAFHKEVAKKIIEGIEDFLRNL